MSNTVAGRYRLFGYGESPQRLLLRDIYRTEPVWVDDVVAGGADDEPSLQEELRPGNLLEATLREEGDRWVLEDGAVVEATTLAFVPQKRAIPGPVDRTWQARTRRDEIGVSAKSDPAGELRYELYTVPQQTETGDRWAEIRKGTVSLDPWYDSLVATEQGAKHLIAVNRPERPYIVIYAVPETSDAVTKLRETLQ